MAGDKLRSGESGRRAQGFSGGGAHGWPRFKGISSLCSMARPASKTCPASKARPASKAWPARLGIVAEIANSVFGGGQIEA
jgi:hypothetical protein